SRLHLERVRIVSGRREALDARAVARHRLHEGGQIRRARHHGELTARPRRCGAPQADDGERGERRPHVYFFAKMCLGIMQCTPLPTSPIWLTRQSTTIEVSE